MQRKLNFSHRGFRCLLVSTLVIFFMAGAVECPVPEGIIPDFKLRVKTSEDIIMAELYVSPMGNDSADGSFSAPLQTLAGAQQAVRNLTAAMTGDIVVHLRGGYYFLEEGLSFNVTDGGSGGFKVIYKNFPQEVPIISGGQMVTGWSQNSTGLWSAPCEVEDFRQLYINGKRGVRARGEADFITETDGDGHILSDTSIQSWKNFHDIEFVYKDIWTLPRVHPLQVINDKLYMQQPAYSWTRYKPDSQNQAPAWIENAYELLDEPGEFYLDKSAQRVYYMPREGEDLGSAEVIAPEIEVMLNISGSPEATLRNLEFCGITFAHGNWLKPNENGMGFVEVQANVYRVLGLDRWERRMSPGNLYASYVSDLAFENCTFSALGTTGLDLRCGIRNSRVSGCTFIDIAGIALQVGDVENMTQTNPLDPRTVAGLLIENNYITNCSLDYMSGPGIFAGYVRNTRIEHNSISNLPYTGISLGWGWSATETVAANNTVKYNHIYGIMNFLRDGGGIYTLSTSPGTNVSYNVIHDSGWNGLYPDERTNQTTWSYNVVWDCDNSFLDHSKYEEASWNEVHHNYLETYPAHLSVWYPERDADQIFGLRPGDEGFPDAIVSQAGVEPAYAHLLPEEEWYWQYERSTDDTRLKTVGVVSGVVALAIGIPALLGLIYIIRKTKNQLSD